jgi:hypothetical protein
MKYCAQSFNGSFRVCRIVESGEYTKYEFLCNVRSFQTWDEANKVAEEISDGGYAFLGYPIGEFINMR